MIAGSDFKDVQGRRELGRAQGQLVDAGPFLHINAKSAKLGEFREYCEVAWQGQIKWETWKWRGIGAKPQENFWG